MSPYMNKKAQPGPIGYDHLNKEMTVRFNRVRTFRWYIFKVVKPGEICSGVVKEFPKPLGVILQVVEIRLDARKLKKF